MARFWQVQMIGELGNCIKMDCSFEADAKQIIEENGNGTLFEFREERNIPHSLPLFVHKSLSCQVYENGKWREVNIF